MLLGDPGAVLGSLGGLGAVLRGLGTISGRSWAVFRHSVVPSWPLRGFDLGNVAFSLVLQGSGSPRTGENGVCVCVCSGKGFGPEGGTTGGE